MLAQPNAPAAAAKATEVVNESIAWFLTWPSQWPGLQQVRVSRQPPGPGNGRRSGREKALPGA